MEVPVGLLAKLWSFVSFLPFFLLLFVLGSLKGIFVGVVAFSIIVVGNTAVVIGLWPAHFIWTYFCVAKSKKLGWVLKILATMILPVPLVLFPVVAIIGSVLGGIGYGFFAPLIATFEAVGENVKEKFYHCLADGSISTVKGSCTAVRDVADFCFHSYMSYMDEQREEAPDDEKPMDIKLLQLPSSLLVSVLAIPVDVPVITGVAIWKSPFMVFKGWKRLFEDLVGREGPFLEAVCVPFAGLAILLWPLAVEGSVIASFLSSFFLALYGGVVVHQEDSSKMGLAYVVAVVAMFDEYTNDLLYLREGSCFPRPRYRHTMSPNATKEIKSPELVNETEGSRNTKLVSEGSRTLKETIQRYTPMQVWDWLFKSCEANGRVLLREGLIDVRDIEACIVKGKCKKLGIKLPAWTILQCLLASADSNSSGILISDAVELTKTNLPRDKVFEWFIGPLFVIKKQVQGLELQRDEQICLKKLVMGFKNERPEDWDDEGFPCTDSIRRARLQAVIRRLEGIVGSLSRFPTFRRRFKNLVKMLYVEAAQTDLLAEHVVGILTSRENKKAFRTIRRDDKTAGKDAAGSAHDNSNNV